MFLRKVQESSIDTLKDFLYRCGDEEKYETCKERKPLEEACVEMFLADMEMYSTIERKGYFISYPTGFLIHL